MQKSRHIQYNYTPVPARSEADYIQNICENQISVRLLKVLYNICAKHDVARTIPCLNCSFTEV